MALKTSSYGTCHSCKALNMAHRSTCYRCGTAVTPPSTTGYTGRLMPNPKAAPRLERRGALRHEVNMPASVLAPNGEVVGKIMIRNIGVGGLLFDSAEAYQLHDQLVLRIELDGETYVVESVVKHCGNVLSNDTPYSSGVEFVKPDGAFLSGIARMDTSNRETWT